MEYLLQQKKNLDDQLLETAADLEKKFETVKKGKEELEAKINKAKVLSEKISRLKSTKGFCTQEDLGQLVIEKTNQDSIIHNSEVAESKVKMLEEELAKIKSSGTIVLPERKVRIKNRIKTLQRSITKAQVVQGLISKAENDSGFCSETEIEKLQKDLHSIMGILRKIQPLNQGKSFFKLN